MNTRRVAIIGSGIAEPELSISLKRAGIDSIVCESRATPRDQAEAFLNLAPNGLNALEALGLQERVAGPGFRSWHESDVAARTGPASGPGTGAQTSNGPSSVAHKSKIPFGVGIGMAAERRIAADRNASDTWGVIVLPRFIGFGLGPP
jgi:2-polyprenyl-6-methoxyphenol hydroxylase-like FAD-dependent oxidoreductase